MKRIKALFRIFLLVIATYFTITHFSFGVLILYLVLLFSLELWRSHKSLSTFLKEEKITFNEFMKK